MAPVLRKPKRTYMLNYKKERTKKLKMVVLTVCGAVGAAHHLEGNLSQIDFLRLILY